MLDVQMTMATMGMGFVCATCLKLERGLNQGKETCEAGLRGLSCAGPISGMGYPQYEGPLSRAALANHCFRCGEVAACGFQTPQGIIGACSLHAGDVVGDHSLTPVAP